LHAHFDHFTAPYPREYQSRYGVLRGVIPEVVDKFMQCGGFAKGFARVRCDECSHEYLLAFSCKGRWFCPPCHQKKVQILGAMLAESILAAVPHHHFTFTIPQMLRPYFRFHHGLLKPLCRIEQSRGVVRSQARRLKSSSIVRSNRGASRRDRGAS